MKLCSKSFFFSLLPFGILVLTACASLCFGTRLILPSELFSDRLSSISRLVVFNVRLPRILLGVICGALLGGSGAVFQGFFRNPLADAGVMGVSSGATLGAICSGFFSFHHLLFISPVSFFAFLGALTASAFIYLFSRFFKSSSSITLLLIGTSSGTFFSAIGSLILLTKEKELHSLYVWTMGSFNGKGWEELCFLIIPSVLSLIMLLLCARHLDILSFGELSAKSLGLNFNFIRNLVLAAGSLAVACAVCAGGIISFVGLIAPHIVRKIYGPCHKVVIFQSMMMGAVLMVISDIFARCLISPSELPVGIITSIIGVPFFMIILAGGKKRVL